MDIIKIANSRYSAKRFDPTKKLDENQLSQLEDLLRVAPSSVNLQPWYFIIATTDEAKEKIAKSTYGDFSFNKDKIVDGSAIVIFSHILDVNEEYLLNLSNVEYNDKRYANQDFKIRAHEVRSMFTNLHKDNLKDFDAWADKQLYLNLGHFLLGAAAMGLDTLAMEGFDKKIIDEEFDLHKKGFASSVIVAVGYHREDDFNKSTPKSRLPKSQIIERV